MIKLNNKNITYVALADSNNSLKAPKEIWYADSNNSVKLVYRRKDALIEGEDYEKYHWLVSNSEDSQTPYIDTLIPPDLNQNIAFSFKVNNSDTNGGEPGIWGTVISSSWNNCVIRCFKNKSYDYIILEFNNNSKDFPQKEDMLIKTDFSEGKEYDCSLSINSRKTALGVINGESKELVANSNVSFVLNPQPTHKLFVESQNTSWSFNSVGFKRFNITNLINLIPCKLLKPVPKWLDANGIRRQAGECGMIDLVSGKFYGNVNSVGTFTVENYYERKEWLQGRNGAYIDTNYYPIVGTDVFSVHFHYDGTVKNPDGGEQNAFGVNYKDSNGSNFIRAYIQKSNKLACSYYKYTDTYPTTNIQSNEWNIDNLLINGSKFQYTANGTSYSFDNNDIQQQICQFPLFIFKNNEQVWGYNNYYLHGDISSFKITDTSSNTKMNLIPCTLTMDLPASMDANNIARTKGTSGMWDLVSDRFYGNVANSGTFKAVNLAEGVDYEVHQWLVGDEAAYIELDNQFNTDGNAFIDAHFKQYAQRSNGYNIIIGNNQSVDGYCIRITFALFIYYDLHKVVNGVANSYRLTKTRDDMEHNVYMSFSSIEIDGVESTIVWGNQFDSSMRNKFTRIYTGDAQYGEITMRSNNKEFHLIPVKLLRPIPSTYDANGIARQAGECGMYDTVNDKFYGNVASSGNFTVEDNN